MSPQLSRRRWLYSGALSALAPAGGGYYYVQRVPRLGFDGRYAYATPEMPPAVHAIVQYANQIQGMPYEPGGGHRVLFDDGFDCSGALSHVLYRAGLLRGPLTSASFAHYGLPSLGRFVTLFVRPGSHVFMVVCGLRFDTTGGRKGEGPRWRTTPRQTQGFNARHPLNMLSNAEPTWRESMSLGDQRTHCAGLRSSQRSSSLFCGLIDSAFSSTEYSRRESPSHCRQ